MTLTLIIILILLGLLFLVLEILVIPGTGIVGIIGFILIAVGIYSAYNDLGAITGHIIMGSTVAVSFLAIYISIRSKTWNKIQLKSAVSGKVNTQEEKVKVGERGKSITRLNPIGKARIENEYYEVRSIGSFIDENREIVVVKVYGNQISVKETNPEIEEE